MNSKAFRRFVFGALSSAFLLSFSLSTRADALDNWTTTQVSSNSFHLSNVVYANGRYVAAGGRSDGGAIMTSEDGLNWTLRADGGWCCNPDLAWGLAYGGGRFVCVGHWGGTASSTNGTNWSYGRVAGAADLSGVAYGHGVFAAVGPPRIWEGTTNSIFYSTDGINWQNAFQFPEEARTVWAVAYGAGKFVAVAEGGYSYTSTDGIVWERANIPGGNKITYLSGRFFVPLGVGVNLVSSDGLTWAALNTGVSGRFGRMGYANGIFMGLTGQFRAYTNVVVSTDGTNWLQRSTQAFYSAEDGESSAFEIASDGRQFVVVGGTTITPGSFFNGFVHSSEALVSIAITDSAPAQIILSGVTGRTYRVDFTPALQTSGTNTWQPLTSLLLPSSPYSLSDPQLGSFTQRFYRAVLLP